jgi:hypothetical protein
MADAAVLVATAASIFGPLALVFALAVRDYAAMSTLSSAPRSLPRGLSRGQSRNPPAEKSPCKHS